MTQDSDRSRGAAHATISIVNRNGGCEMTASAQLVVRKSWEAIADELDERGYALTGPLLTATDCERLVRIYDDKRAFRSRIVMERHNFGRGEYQYFADPLPPLV